MKIDRVYYNGVIRTMVSEGDTVEALAVHNGTIVACFPVSLTPICTYSMIAWAVLRRT